MSRDAEVLAATHGSSQAKDAGRLLLVCSRVLLCHERGRLGLVGADGRRRGDAVGHRRSERWPGRSQSDASVLTSTDRKSHALSGSNRRAGLRTGHAVRSRQISDAAGQICHPVAVLADDDQKHGVHRPGERAPADSAQTVHELAGVPERGSDFGACGIGTAERWPRQARRRLTEAFRCLLSRRIFRPRRRAARQPLERCCH